MTLLGTPVPEAVDGRRGTDMVANSGGTRRFLAAVAASTFALGIGAVAGVVPRAGDVATVDVAGARPLALDETWARPVKTLPAPATTVMTTPPTTEPVPPVETTVPEPQRVEPPAEPPVVLPPPVEPPPVVVVEPVLPAPAPAPPPATVPRRQPTSAEIDRAIAGLRPYVRSLLPINPTHAQVAELGDKICTAFDEGQSVAQVKATGAQLVKKVPFATLLQGGDDYILRTGVVMYCPGHAPRLG